ncbi:MAG: 2,3-bisphosphoglycerate-independent phosphoglycerate mutase [candidate division SR1 bacterium]|nr:2,3-bisphosphoglycerate-independent phosphoglycerate mutase [candidate division SR1 bacterium]
MKKLALIILDGFGINKKTPQYNGITQTNSPVFKKLFSEPYASLDASGKAVGLPAGQMGNSEVGHMTIGSGRIIKQNLVEIDEMLDDKSFAKIPEFQAGIAHCKENDSNLHLIQLFGPGGVHASDSHLKKILKLIPKEIQVSLHLFGDGRDLPPMSMLALMQEFEKFLKAFPNVKISSLAGRYYGMDRDNNRERVQKSYDEIVFGQLQTSDTPSEYIAKSYEKLITDEFLLPVSFVWGEQIESGDAVFNLNFRSDRAREITQAIMVSINKKYAEDYPTREKHFLIKRLDNIYFVAMNTYYKEYEGKVFMEQPDIKNTLSEVISHNELRQLHLAETEKFAHVTKFFNGDRHIVFDGEKDILVPSHKVATYDLDPEMSAQEIYDQFVAQAKDFDFIVVNFANGDMVGHSGKLDAVVKAVKKLDGITKDIIAFCDKNNYELLITADHGNCEDKGTPEAPITAHSTNPVPCRYISKGKTKSLKKTGGLSDIAPTVLTLMGLKIPKEMKGKSLI